jgi:large subunit ribosomal protein L29
MKSKEIRERTTEDLVQLRDMMKKDLFSYRMKNATSQLDDSSLIGKTRKDIARIELVLHERANQASTVDEKGGEA